jgi:hypothetical protein
VRSFILLFAVAAVSLLVWRKSSSVRHPEVVQAADAKRVAFLIRFGADGAGDVDWSGRISPQPSRLEGWQFDSNDSASPAGWKCATREQNYWDTPYERRMGPTSNRRKTTGKGILVEFDSSTRGDIRITTAQGEFSFRAANNLWSETARFLNGRVEVRAAPVLTRLATTPEVEDNPSLWNAADGTTWLAYQSWSQTGDQLFVRRRSGAAWSKPEALTASGKDIFRTAITGDKAGGIWVIWSEQVSGNFDLYGRRFDGKKWAPAERLTTAQGSDIYHSLARGRDGRLYLVYQSSRAGNFDIYLRAYDGKWSPEIAVSTDAADEWEPALAPSPDGGVTILWDTYAKGNFDVVSKTWRNGKLGPLTFIAESGAFEARASAAYDAQGRMWVAWEEGDWNWGKDYGNLIPESGRGLLVRRQTRVAVMAEGRMQDLTASLANAVPEDLRQVFQHPRLALDGRGNPWVFFHYRVNLPRPAGRSDDTRTSSYRALWRVGSSSYQNGQWTPMLDLAGGFGRIDAPLDTALANDGSLDVAWETDGRVWPHGVPQEQDIVAAKIPAGPEAAAPRLTAFQPSSEDLPSSHTEEAADVSRVRAHRVQVGNRSFRIARGDVHRHTDLSWDGNRDGSLDDSYRYALDAVAFDYLGVCDHQAGQSIPYNWWRIQKAVDLYTIAGRFAPLYSYERSLPYPNGHRNVLFAERGNPILEISKSEVDGSEGAGKLYQYLKRFSGITTSHTSATGAGTDWRDHDDAVEPVVEIYQGYRNSYEDPESPRHSRQAEMTRFGAGMVRNAWAKQIPLGVQASSDHVSTHISYAAVYVDAINRKAILDGFRNRRSYAATDNLILELRVGGHFMGERFSTSSAAPVEAYVHGTGPIARVSLVKNNQIVYVAPGNSKPELKFTYTDQDRTKGRSYYYIRAEQENGQLAWSSPVWVEYQ